MDTSKKFQVQQLCTAPEEEFHHGDTETRRRFRWVRRSFVARAARPWPRYAAALAGTPGKPPERSDRGLHAHEERCALAPSTESTGRTSRRTGLHGRAARATISGHAPFGLASTFPRSSGRNSFNHLLIA